MARSYGVMIVLLFVCKSTISTAQTTNSIINQFNTSQYTISLSPSSPLKFRQTDKANLTVTVTRSPNAPSVLIRLVVGQSQVTGTLVYGIDGAELNVTMNDTETTAVFELTSNLVGEETILFGFYPIDEPDRFLGYSSTTYSIYSDKTTTFTQTFGTILGAVCTSLTMSVFVSRLSTDALRKFFGGPKSGLLFILLSYVLMPPISFGLAFAWDMPYHFVFALLCVGCCPPGSPANAMVLFMGGELETSIIITAMGTVLSVAFFPIWSTTLGQWLCIQAYGSTHILRFPVVIFDIFICIFFLPSIVTFATSYKWPRASRIFINFFLRPVSMLGLLVAIVILFVTNINWVIPLVTTWTYIACPTSISLVGYVVGIFVSYVLGRMPIEKALTFGVQSGLANIYFAIVMCGEMLPAPDGSTVLVVIAFFVISSLIISILLIVLVNVARWVHERYVPKTFSLSATDQRIEYEKRRTVRAEKKMALTRSVSMISSNSYGMMPMIPTDSDENFEPTDFDPNDSERGTPTETNEEQPIDNKVAFVIAKY